MKCKRKKGLFGLDDAASIALISAIVGAIGTGATVGTNIHQAKVNDANARLKQRYDTMSENDKQNNLFTGNLQSFYNNQDAVEQRKNDLILPTLNNSQFRAGGVRYFNRTPMAKYGCRKIR